MANKTRKTIPYYLFKAQKDRKNRTEEEKQLYLQLAKIYALRHKHFTSIPETSHIYRKNASGQEEIKVVSERFIYDYLLQNHPNTLTYRKRVLTYEEFIDEINHYNRVLKEHLIDGNAVLLPHFLGIIRLRCKQINRFNFTLKTTAPKKVIYLQWENKFFARRILNVINIDWFSIKISDKEVIREVYKDLPKNQKKYSIGYNLPQLAKKIT